MARGQSRRDGPAVHEGDDAGSGGSAVVPNMSSCRSFELALILVIISAGPVRAWGCAGHHIVALIAKQHLSARALEATVELLETNPIDSRLVRYCKDEAADPFVNAATWADDVKKAEGTGTWHYMDIPRSLTHGDLNPFCEPVGPLRDGSRTGCVLSAIRDQLGVLQNGSPIDRARALRYIIHLVVDPPTASACHRQEPSRGKLRSTAFRRKLRNHKFCTRFGIPVLFSKLPR